MLDADRIATAVAGLDPASRALLELWSRRGLSDDEIAEVLRVEPAEVAGRREHALGQVGDALGVDDSARGDLAEQLGRLEERHWRGEPAAASVKSDEDPASRRSRVAVVAVTLSLLTLVVGVGLLIALGAGVDEEEPARSPAGKAPSTGTARTEAPAPPARPRPRFSGGPVRTMQRLNDTRGRGTAQLLRAGRRAQLRLRASRFLRPRGGGYAVWLFNSREDARRLYATSRTSIRRDIPLPRDFTGYRFVEVARAIPTLESDHSGLSLLRVQVSALRR